MKPLIFDRTSEDIANRTSKGYFNAEDINRIEEWCRYISSLLNSYGYITSISTKTNWNNGDFLTLSQVERLRSNVIKIKNSYYTLQTTPNVPSTLNHIDYEKINAIEKLLCDVENIMAYTKLYFIRSGVSNAGQVRLWQQKYIREKLWSTLQKEYWINFSSEETWEGLA